MNDVDMCHVMIDLETFGTSHDAVIRTIGAVQFDLKGNIKERFHKGINIQSCLNAGLRMDGLTIEWWLKQSKQNIDRLLAVAPVEDLYYVLIDFEATFAAMNKGTTCVWSHGSNFDVVILENAYRAIGRKVWWKYSNVRDSRTLFDVANYIYTAKGGHDALEDATSQALAVAETYQRLKKEVV